MAIFDAKNMHLLLIKNAFKSACNEVSNMVPTTYGVASVRQFWI